MRMSSITNLPGADKIKCVHTNTASKAPMATTTTQRPKKDGRKASSKAEDKVGKATTDEDESESGSVQLKAFLALTLAAASSVTFGYA